MNFIEELIELCKKHGLTEARAVSAGYEFAYMSKAPEVICVIEFRIPPTVGETMQRIMVRGGNLL